MELEPKFELDDEQLRIRMEYLREEKYINLNREYLKFLKFFGKKIKELKDFPDVEKMDRDGNIKIVLTFLYSEEDVKIYIREFLNFYGLGYIIGDFNNRYSFRLKGKMNDILHAYYMELQFMTYYSQDTATMAKEKEEFMINNREWLALKRKK